MSMHAKKRKDWKIIFGVFFSFEMIACGFCHIFCNKLSTAKHATDIVVSQLHQG